MTGTRIRIRRASAGDGDAVAALETGQYRPEDEPEVAAMRRRAEQARLAGARWSPIPPTPAGSEDADPPRGPIERYDHVWVAEREGAPGDPTVVGVVAARAVGDTTTADLDTAEASGLWTWTPSRPLVELRHLRVAAWIRRIGLGSRLVRQVIDHAAATGAKAVVLNTTAAQRPARKLYERCGFREVGVTYVGEYELVWMEHPLRP
ncbi:GNAT family N-acetyltransferase [Flindersiella endophytica]